MLYLVFHIVSLFLFVSIKSKVMVVMGFKAITKHASFTLTIGIGFGLCQVVILFAMNDAKTSEWQIWWLVVFASRLLISGHRQGENGNLCLQARSL